MDSTGIDHRIYGVIVGDTVQVRAVVINWKGGIYDIDNAATDDVTIGGKTATDYPANVSGGGYTFSNNTLKLYWTGINISSDKDFLGYEVRDENANWGTRNSHQIYFGSATFVTLNNITTSSPGPYYVKAVNTSRVYSQTAYQITPSNSAPAQVGVITVTSKISGVLFEWPASSDALHKDYYVKVKISSGGVWSEIYQNATSYFQFLGTGDASEESVYIEVKDRNTLNQTSATARTADGAAQALPAEGTSFIWKGSWDSGTAYVENDTVEYLNRVYISIQAGTNKPPISEPAYWDSMAEGFKWKGAWSSSITYYPNDIVTLNGIAYICILSHSNHTPPNATYWEILADKVSLSDYNLDAPMLEGFNFSIAAGTISWDAGTIYYKNAAYSVNSGNTTDAYVYLNLEGSSPKDFSHSNSRPTLGGNVLLFCVKVSSTKIDASIRHALLHSAIVQTGLLITDEAQIDTGTVKSAHIDNLQVNNAHIANLTIATGKIANNAVTQVASVTSDTTNWIDNTDWEEILSVTINASAANTPLIVWGTINVLNNHASPESVQFKIEDDDGNVLAYSNQWIFLPVSKAIMLSFNVIDTSHSSGNNTFKVYLKSTNIAWVSAEERTIVAMETKK